MNSKILSIVIPAYQSVQTIERAVASALSIPSNAIEVVVVNDGSSDGTQFLLDKLASKDPRLVIVSQHNMGRSAARNTGVEVSSGQWVMFLDSDDYLIESSLSRMLECCEKSDSPLVIFGMNANGEQRRVEESNWDSAVSCTMPANHLVETIIKKYLFDCVNDSRRYEVNSAWSRLYRRDLLVSLTEETKGLFCPFPLNLRFSEDRLFNIAYLRLLKDQQIEFVPVDLYFWDYESSQTCGTLHNDDARSLIVFHNIVIQMVEMGFIDSAESNYLIAREVISQFQRLVKLSRSSSSLLVKDYMNLFGRSDFKRAIRCVPTDSFCCSFLWRFAGRLIGCGFAWPLFVICRFIFSLKQIF